MANIRPLAATYMDDAFATLLAKRNIEAKALQIHLPEVYARWRALFADHHPESFLAQIRFEINATRRRLQGLATPQPLPGPVAEGDTGVLPL